MAALLIPDQAAVAVDVDVSETESDRPIEVEERLIKCPFALPQDCPIMEYGGGVSVVASPLLLVGGGTLAKALFLPHAVAGIFGVPAIRVVPARPLEVVAAAAAIPAAPG